MPCMTMVGGMERHFERVVIFLLREAEWKLFFHFVLLLLLWITFIHTSSKKQLKKWKSTASEKKKEFPGVLNIPQLMWHWVCRWGKPNYIALEAGGRTFGSVYQVKIGSTAIVAVMEIDLAKRLMSSSSFMNRLPDFHIIFERSFKKPLGLLFGGGENWSHCREFSKRTLSNLGFGKGHEMEPFIIEELESTVEKLEREFSLLSNSNEDEEVILCPHGFFHIPTLNILWRLIAGSRFSHEDPELQNLLKYFYKWNRSFNLGATPLCAFPMLRHIPYLTEHDYWVQGHEKFHNFFKTIINSKRQDRRFMENPADFIDHYLQEMEMQSKNPNPNQSMNYYSDEQLLTLCTDLFMAGGDTTSNSLEFAILFMMLNSEVQKRVQAEIDNVIGYDRTPSLVYKNRMIYTEATTLEILRHGCAIPVTGRCPMKDMQVNDYLVAKGTQMAINIHAIHFSQKIWEDPHAFRPERFLDPTGRKIINTDKILPFGHGKRKCLGESTSRNTFFLFFVGLLQKYSFHLSPQHGSPVLKDICGLSRAPKPYHALIRKREKKHL